MSSPAPRERDVLRATSGTVAMIVSGVVAIFLLGDAVLRAGWGEMLLLAPWVLLAVWSVYLLMFASAIETDATAATVQNFLRRTRLPWGAITDIRLRYQVVFVYAEGARELKAFGGPAAGRPGRPSRTRADGGRREPPALREVDALRDRWDAAVRAGAPGGIPSRSWDLIGIGSLAAIVVWAAVAVMITGGPA